MSSTRGVRWLRWVLLTPPMSAATAETRAELGVPGPVDRLGGQRERADREVQEPLGVLRGEPAVVDRDVGQRQQLGGEELAGVEETAQPLLEPRVEEASVLGHQQGGEHPERVRRQLLALPRAGTRWRPPGYGRRRGVAQVVEPARRTCPGHRTPEPPGPAPRAVPDPDRAVPLRGDPVDAAQPFGTGALPRPARAGSPAATPRPGSGRRGPPSPYRSETRAAKRVRSSVLVTVTAAGIGSPPSAVGCVHLTMPASPPPCWRGETGEGRAVRRPRPIRDDPRGGGTCQRPPSPPAPPSWWSAAASSGSARPTTWPGPACRDVLLLDRDALGSGSTCKAAGGVRAQFSDAVNIELGARSLRGLRPTSPSTFGQEIDLHRVGYLFLLDQPGARRGVRAHRRAAERRSASPAG